MSSLATLIRKRGAECWLSKDELQDISEAAPDVYRDICNPLTPRVNLNNIVDEIFDTDLNLRVCVKDAEDITPFFRCLWFEFLVGSVVFGVCAYRNESDLPDCRHNVRFYVFSLDHRGFAWMSSCVDLYTDHFGRVVPDQGSVRFLGFDDLNQAHMKQASEMASLSLAIVGEGLTRINTEGTIVNPPFRIEQPRNQKVREIKPACVWHTLHVGHLPGVADQTPGLPMEETQEKREHWVRACRRDYRMGKGLFGRIKKLIWVPEHKRGNPELGLVVHEYVAH